VKTVYSTVNTITVTGNLNTGYRAGGIKAAATLYRLIFGTWEAVLFTPLVFKKRR
jgi:hypothetical protein